MTIFNEENDAEMGQPASSMSSLPELGPPGSQPCSPSASTLRADSQRSERSTSHGHRRSSSLGVNPFRRSHKSEGAGSPKGSKSSFGAPEACLQSAAIGINNVALRGSTLRNTE